MKQTDRERKMLDELFEKKSKVSYDSTYVSSSIVSTHSSLGTLESDVSGKYGRWEKEEFRAFKLAQLSMNCTSISSVLDVGGGNLLAASYFVENGKNVDVSDFSTSPYLTDGAIKQSGIEEFIDGDFNDTKFKKKYDLVWASHVLEHQLDVHKFVSKLVKLVDEDGYLAIAVPPRKPFIVSGHINLFNPGLLLYRMVLCGVDCTDAKIFQYDGNICLLVQVKKFKLPKLNYDIGDIELLEKYFPFPAVDGFNGDFTCCNLNDDELQSVYGQNSVFVARPVS